MAQEDDILGSYVDRAAVDADTEFMLKQLNDIYASFKRINSLKITLEGSSSFKAVTDATRQYRTEQEQLLKVQQQIQDTHAKRMAAESEYGKALISEKEALRQAAAEQKNLAREQNSAAGSLEQMRAQLIRLNKEYDNLSASERSASQGTTLQGKISGLSTELKNLEGATGRFQRNVGNYPESARIIVDALERARQKTAQLNTELGANHPAAQAARRELEGLQRVTANPQFLNVAAKAGDATSEFRNMSKTLVQLNREGLGNTDFATKLKDSLAELRNEIQHSRGEIKKLSSDSYAFDQFAKGVSFLAHSYETAVGALELFGNKNEDAQQAIKKLVAVQAVANGIQGIANELTERGTIINRALVAVQTLYATATDASATATVRLAAATKLLLGGFVIAALVYIIYKMTEFANAAKNVVTQQKTLIEVGRASADAYGKEKAQLDLLITSIKTEGLSRAEKFKILKELQDKYPGYFDNIKTEKDLNDKLADAYNKAAQGILLKARAQAAGDLLGTNEADRLKATLDHQEKINGALEDFNNKMAAPNTGNRRDYEKQVKDSYKNIVKIVDDEYDTEIKKIDQKSKLLIKTVQDSDADILKLGGRLAKPDKPKKEDDQANKDIVARFQTYKAAQERLADLNKETADDDKVSYAERLLALGEYLRIKQRLSDQEAEIEIKTQKHSTAEVIAIRRKADDDQIRLAQDAGKTFEKIQDQYLAALKKNDSKQVDEYGVTYNKLHKLLDEYLKKRGEAEAKANLKSTEDYKKAHADAIKSLGDELKGLSFDLLEGSVDKEKNAIQDQINALDKKKQKDIEVANSSIQNAQDKAATIATIEARAQAQTEQLQKRQQQLDEKKARFEKAKAIADIIENTTTAIVKTLAEYPGHSGIILAAIIGAIGAAQLARVIATPIPHYAEGTTDHIGGKAVVGDGGREELVIEPSGRMYKTPSSSTVMDLPAHSIVLPDANMMWQMTRSSTDRALNYMQPSESQQLEQLRAEISQSGKNMVRAVKAIPRQKSINIDLLKLWVGSAESSDSLLKRLRK